MIVLRSVVRGTHVKASGRIPRRFAGRCPPPHECYVGLDAAGTVEHGAQNMTTNRNSAARKTGRCPAARAATLVFRHTQTQ